MEKKMHKLTCLQVHNDYLIPGGETKTTQMIANVLEENHICVIRYYKHNNVLRDCGVIQKVIAGAASLFNWSTVREVEKILAENTIDFALIHNVSPLISNAIYYVLSKRGIPIVKYLQNYNLVCLNGSLERGEDCKKCAQNSWLGVKRKCYKRSSIYSFFRYLAKKDMDRHYLKKITAFMPNSQFVRDRHIDFGIDGAKMYVMYNYIDVIANQVIHQEKEGQSYLYFGRLSREKGIFTVLDAFRQLPGISLQIMGSGDLEDAIAAYIAEEKLENVTILGSRTGDEVAEIVARAKCVIVSSEWDEPLPRTIMEAYAQGTPVIGADRGGIPEMIRDGETGFVYHAGVVYDLVCKVRAMEAMLPQEYMAMCRACNEETVNRYSKEKYVERFMDCIGQIL